MQFDLTAWIASSLTLGLRIVPVLAFAPPFTLVRMPAQFRALFGLGLSAALVSANPSVALLHDVSPAVLIPAAIRELALGTLFLAIFQALFGALYVAGRTIDVQAGFGLALLIDPTSKNQVPLVGSLFVYATAALFFAIDGHIALLRLIAASLETVPLGSWQMPDSLERLTALILASSSIALGFAGAAIATMFMIDLGIALLSRTVPQMNVLVFGLQVKTLALLLVLPGVFGLGGALLVRMLALGIDALPGMI
jgi:flagellar biosynthetic protein FliR